MAAEGVDSVRMPQQWVARGDATICIGATSGLVATELQHVASKKRSLSFDRFFESLGVERPPIGR